MNGINRGKVYNGTSAGEFTNYYSGVIPNSTMEFVRETFLNDAWNYTEYRKQLNDMLWEVTEGVWYRRSKYIANRICHLDYFEL